MQRAPPRTAKAEWYRAGLTVAAEAEDVEGTGLAGGFVAIGAAPGGGLAFGIIEIGTAPARHRAGIGDERGEPLCLGRVAAGIDIHQLQRALDPAHLDLGRLRLGAVEIADRAAPRCRSPARGCRARPSFRGARGRIVSTNEGKVQKDYSPSNFLS